MEKIFVCVLFVFLIFVPKSQAQTVVVKTYVNGQIVSETRVEFGTSGQKVTPNQRLNNGGFLVRGTYANGHEEHNHGQEVHSHGQEAHSHVNYAPVGESFQRPNYGYREEYSPSSRPPNRTLQFIQEIGKLAAAGFVQGASGALAQRLIFGRNGGLAVGGVLGSSGGVVHYAGDGHAH